MFEAGRKWPEERPERLLAVEGREEVRAGVGCRPSRGQGPKQGVDWLFSAWLQAFRQGSGKTQILLCRRQAPEKQ